LETKEGVLISSSIRDITARKKIQEALRKSERLAAIGETVTGLAHESRNALQRSQSCLEMLAVEVESQPKAMDLVARIQQAQDDLQHLFEAVRKYAAPVILNARDCHLGLVVQECWDNLAYLWQKKQIKLNYESGKVDLRCWADPVAMGRVLGNIFLNSLQACDNCAEIGVEWFDAQLDDRPALRIVLRDNGPGLGPDQRAKIFDPFYSTKTRGAGLGMAFAKRIVEAHHGRIAVGHGEQPGTQIHITLPRTSRA
jgi:signal transduction histidine kinase